jgi:hypothetical protein
MKFHERFDINVNIDEARKSFVNRAYNRVWLSFFGETFSDNEQFRVHKAIASALGDRFKFHQNVDQLVGLDFLRNLLALETMYAELTNYHRDDGDLVMQRLLTDSEVDLGIEWRDGKFLPKGAKLLDEHLVNDQLHWLRGAKYDSVLKPFEKGLRHLMEAHARAEVLSDVITDMYEAVEALAKKLTDRPSKDLSENRELFISKVKGSDVYKTLLKDYIEYANKFRHAEAEGKPKPNVDERETESFVYLTGVFLRLGMPEE